MNSPPEPPAPSKKPESKSNPWSTWIVWVALAALVGVLLIGSMLLPRSSSPEKISYSSFVEAANDGAVESVKVNNDSRSITGEFKEPRDGNTNFSTTGPLEGPPLEVQQAITDEGGTIEFVNAESNWLAEWLILLLPVGLIIAFFIFMQRRAQGQMGAVMNIGRSKAKVYTTEKPKTTFDDVAGYGPVKQEIAEVVDFLKHPAKFREIGARIPKGVLLVGPPGTGKTLIARAVAGEAGVPFISVTGSDFMEMFVGVGAARVRDLFQTARKQSPAIIFIDEIDSIGRKRGAGLGGGHDEREQTLNQMLAEMDGFEATEGIVMMAATNRPDILDPALLRPGRFDRQVMVPLPTQDERESILKVHLRDKKVADDIDVKRLARGTPGMSGADLANLVNESALFAVRRGEKIIHAQDFDAARDRIMMGLRRESMALSPEEQLITAYHEAGHALCAYVLPHAEPVHKVTILPTGMALGVTHLLPEEERHIYTKEYFDSALSMTLGGRVAEDLVFGHQSNGASNDLQRATEMARRMVREWGMSSRIGPMAWGSQGAVFLGDDLMHSRDYSDDTARVIDEEIEKILREAEERTRTVLSENRAGLDSLATALLENETVSGEEVTRLVDEAMGRKVGGPRAPVEIIDGTSRAPVFRPAVVNGTAAGSDAAMPDIAAPLQSPDQP